MKCCKKSNKLYKVKLLPQKISNFIKAIKPAVKFVTKNYRTNTVTPSTCNYDLVESEENKINESDFLHVVHFRFHDEIAENKENEPLETTENKKNEELEKILLQTKTNFKRCSVHEMIGREMRFVRASSDGYFATPARFIECETKKFVWASLPDADVRRQEGVYVTECQVAKKQTPVSVV